MTTNTVSVFAGLDLDPAILALVNEAYAKPIAPKKEKGEAKPRAPKGEKPQKSAKEKAEPIKWLIAAPSTMQDSRSFLLAIRESGVRLVERENPITGAIGLVPVFDPILARSDEKFAVALFQGWTDEPHGTQLDRAVLHAHHLSAFGAPQVRLSGPIDHAAHNPERHAASRSVEGYIAGMPNATQKVLADLAGRERAAVTEVATMTALFEAAGREPITFEKRLLELAKDELDSGDKNMRVSAIIRQRPEVLKTLLAIAEQRLDEIRLDLEALYGGDLSPEAINRAHQALLGRGMPTFEEQVVLMHTTPRGGSEPSNDHLH